MEPVVIVYTTWPSVVEAEAAGRALVDRQLAACVNILPGMISLYRWQGAIERGHETVMLVKTRASCAEDVQAAVAAMHPYDVPAILSLGTSDTLPAFQRWVLEQTGQGAG